MISFKPVTFAHRKRRDGTYPVSIRVTFARKSRYLPTTITCTAADLTRSLKVKNPEKVALLNELCDRLRREAARMNPFELEGKDADWVVSRLKAAMRQQDFRLDFFEFADEYILTKREGNRGKYGTALRIFERFLGKRSIDVNEITHSLLVSFAAACDSGTKLNYNRHLGAIAPTRAARSGPISPQYLSRLNCIYEAAKDRYNDEDGGVVLIPRSPFRKLELRQPAPRRSQKAQEPAVIQAMIDSPADDPSRVALDLFLVGFALMGANMADLWEAVPPKGGCWAYRRRKTRDRRADGAYIRCEVAPEIGPFLARLGAGRSTRWWLPSLRSSWNDPGTAGHAVNRGLKAWCEARGIEPFTYYAGRHTWATLARRIGVEKATVDEGLGHVGDYRVADIYAERDWDRIAAANRRVLALFRW